MRIRSPFLIFGIILLSACSKSGFDPVDSKLKLIDGYSIAQVDSIARHYGWTFTPGDTAKDKPVMKIKDFISLAEVRIANGLNAKTINIAGTLTPASTVLGDYPDDGNTMVGLNGQNAPLYNLTWHFPDFKNRAFPSIYNMTFSVYTNSDGSQPQVSGADFMYDGADGPVLNTDWSYNHQGSTISGIASAFNVQNYGTEHETVHILGGTIQHHYVVQFKINNQNVENVTSKVRAIITLTQIN